MNIIIFLENFLASYEHNMHTNVPAKPPAQWLQVALVLWLKYLALQLYLQSRSSSTGSRGLQSSATHHLTKIIPNSAAQRT